MVAAPSSRALGWLLLLLLLTLVAVARIADVTALAHTADQLVDWIAGFTYV